MWGFSVDLAALSDASAGIAGVVREMQGQPVNDIDCPSESVGHRGLSRAFHDFCERWHFGVDLLAKDGEQISQLLSESVATYARADAAASEGLAAIAGDWVASP
jgi:hypothetical protein